MSFTDQIIATLIGSSSAFLFGIILFLITSYFKSKNERKNFLKRLQAEIKSNISLYQNNISMILSVLSTQNYKVLKPLPFGTIFNSKSYFLEKSFENGYIYDLLDEEQIYKMQSIESKINFDNNQNNYNHNEQTTLSNEEILKQNETQLEYRKNYLQIIIKIEQIIDSKV